MKARNVHRLLAIAVLITVVKSAALPPSSPKAEAQAYYDSISFDRRDDFIRYFLAEALIVQGIPVHAPKLANIDPVEEFGEPPTDFATDLLAWYKLEMSMNDFDIKEVVESTTDKGLGGCDPSSVGCHCCPFWETPDRAVKSANFNN